MGSTTGPAYRRPHGYGWSMASASETLEVDGREIRVTNPEKVYFPDAPGGPITKPDLVRYWVEVSPAAPPRLRRPAAGGASVRGWGRGGGLLSEPRAEGRPAVGRAGDDLLPE